MCLLLSHTAYNILIGIYHVYVEFNNVHQSYNFTLFCCHLKFSCMYRFDLIFNYCFELLFIKQTFGSTGFALIGSCKMHTAGRINITLGQAFDL